MNKRLSACLLLVSLGGMTSSAWAEGPGGLGFFSVPGGFCRWLGVGYGRGYHAPPCPPRHGKHCAPHGQAGVQAACPNCGPREPLTWPWKEWFPNADAPTGASPEPLPAPELQPQRNLSQPARPERTYPFGNFPAASSHPSASRPGPIQPGQRLK